MNDWNPKKISLRSHRPPSPSIEPMRGKRNVAQRFAVEIEKLEL